MYQKYKINVSFLCIKLKRKRKICQYIQFFTSSSELRLNSTCFLPKTQQNQVYIIFVIITLVFIYGLSMSYLFHKGSNSLFSPPLFQEHLICSLRIFFFHLLRTSHLIVSNICFAMPI